MSLLSLMANTKLSSSQCSEPSIVNSEFLVPPSMLEDWLYFLAEKNALSVQNPEKFRDFLTSSKIVEYIFNICVKFQQPSAVKHAAVEIFDRFLCNHVKDVHKQVKESNQNRSHGQPIEWEKVEVRVSNQLVLRIISCIQVASKMHCHYHFIRPKVGRNFLRQSGYTYSWDSLLNSEMRVLKTLDYKIDIITPLGYIEILIGILGHNDAQIEQGLLYDVTMKLVDLYYLKRDEIYNRLFQLACGDKGDYPISDDDKHTFKCIKADYMLLAVAIIAAASRLLGERLCSHVGKQLSVMTKIPTQDITDYSCIILVSVVEE